MNEEINLAVFYGENCPRSLCGEYKKLGQSFSILTR